MKCEKCGREAYREEDVDTGGSFKVCEECGISTGNCICRPLNLKPLFEKGE